MYDNQSPFAMTAGRRQGESLSDGAHSAFQAAIIDCQLPPGTIVSEAELSTRFAYGLAAVRTALVRLTEAGWIAPERRRGSKILPVSGAHLADLSGSRLCLEPTLMHQAAPLGLIEELRLRATVYEAAIFQAPVQTRQALLHQERALFLLIAQVVAAPRIRGWLSDTWDLSLRADRHMEQAFGILRNPLPLAELAFALADGNHPAAMQILDRMRHAFDLRAARALSRSETALAAMPASGRSPRRGVTSTAAPTSNTSTRTRSTKGDSA